MTWAADNLGANLTVKQGDHPLEIVSKSTDDVIAHKKRLGIYFSAHWVSP